jgi:exopolysaccharide biosynthesis polyprenyl glycosylphosphotransferase
MLKENWRFIARLERAGDLFIIVASFFLAYFLRVSAGQLGGAIGLDQAFTGAVLAPLKDYFIVLFIALFGYLVTLSWMGAYGSMRMSSPFRLIQLSFISSGVVFFTLSSALFLLKIDLSRSFILLFCTQVAFFLCIERFFVLKFLRFWRKRGKNFRNVLICGIGSQALKLVKEITARPELGIRIRGFVDLREPVTHHDRERILEEIRDFRKQVRRFPGRLSNRVLLGSAAGENALKRYAVDEVIFTDVIEVMPAVRELVCSCAEEGVRTTIAADLFSIGLVKSGMSYFGGTPLIHFHTPPGDQWELSVKRWVDIVVSAILLVVLSPLYLIIALAIVLASPGPIFFRQRRVGLNGRIFFLYKFRSMVVGAERELAALKAHNEMSGPVFKIQHDPRVTPFGRLLRRFSLDELPQLWNVLKGDMSLVGPRPPIPGEVSLYERRDRRRLSMRPGLTCTWQVSGRNNISSFEEWVRLDLEYIDNWSLGRDLLLMLRTIPAVFFGHGAR